MWLKSRLEEKLFSFLESCILMKSGDPFFLPLLFQPGFLLDFLRFRPLFKVELRHSQRAGAVASVGR